MWVMRAAVSWWRAVRRAGVSGRVASAWGDSVCRRWLMSVCREEGRGRVVWVLGVQVLQSAVPCVGSKRVGWGVLHCAQWVS